MSKVSCPRTPHNILARDQSRVRRTNHEATESPEPKPPNLEFRILTMRSPGQSDLVFVPMSPPLQSLHKILASSSPKFCKTCSTVPRHDSDQGWACKECFSCGNQSFCQFPD